MGRRATVASGNVWYEARMEAAKGNEKLSSRFGAAHEAGMSEDAIKNTELGLEKQMPVDKAVILADLYNAPQLLKHYCLHECPIGKNNALSEEVLSISHVTVKLLKELRVSQLRRVTEKLVDIAADDLVTQDELEDLEEVVDYLDKIAVTISELKTIRQRAMGVKDAC